MPTSAATAPAQARGRRHAPHAASGVSAIARGLPGALHSHARRIAGSRLSRRQGLSEDEMKLALPNATLPSERMSHLFSVALLFTSDSPSDAVLPADGRDGSYIGSGRGTVAGDRIRGTMAW